MGKYCPLWAAKMAEKTGVVNFAKELKKQLKTLDYVREHIVKRKTLFDQRSESPITTSKTLSLKTLEGQYLFPLEWPSDSSFMDRLFWLFFGKWRAGIRAKSKGDSPKNDTEDSSKTRGINVA